MGLLEDEHSDILFEVDNFSSGFGDDVVCGIGHQVVVNYWAILC